MSRSTRYICCNCSWRKNLGQPKLPSLDMRCFSIFVFSFACKGFASWMLSTGFDYLQQSLYTCDIMIFVACIDNWHIQSTVYSDILVSALNKDPLLLIDICPYLHRHQHNHHDWKLTLKKGSNQIKPSKLPRKDEEVLHKSRLI